MKKNPLYALSTTALNRYIETRLAKQQCFRDIRGMKLTDALSVCHAICSGTIDPESFLDEHGLVRDED